MDDKRVSRRELLRTIGLAGAATWAAPVVTSGRARAFTDRCRKRKARRLCKGDPCCFAICTCGAGLCGTCSSDVGDGSFCFVRNSDLRCYCAEDVFCSEAGHCVTDADCKAQGLGDICITNNGCTGCGSSTAVCSTRCCTPLTNRSKPLRTADSAERPRGGRARGRRWAKADRPCSIACC
jgi:hypothetical protein